jgi:hypothetical protein
MHYYGNVTFICNHVVPKILPQVYNLSNGGDLYKQSLFQMLKGKGHNRI